MSITLLELLEIKSLSHFSMPQFFCESLGSSMRVSLESEMQALIANDAATPKEAAIVALALLEKVMFP